MGCSSSLELYRSPSIPLGNPPGVSSWAGDPRGGWNFPGVALSASSVRWSQLADPSRLLYARWVLVWNPNNPSPGIYVGARLVLADSGPSNLEQIAMISRNVGDQPIVSAVDITAILKATPNKQIIQQVQGDSVSRGPLIYASSIDIEWQ